MLNQDFKIKMGRAHQKDRRERTFEDSCVVQVRGQKKRWATQAQAGGSCRKDVQKLGAKDRGQWPGIGTHGEEP